MSGGRDAQTAKAVTPKGKGGRDLNEDDDEDVPELIDMVRKDRNKWKNKALGCLKTIKEGEQELMEVKESFAEREQRYKRKIKRYAKDLKERKKFHHGRSKMRVCNMSICKMRICKDVYMKDVCMQDVYM